MSTNGVVATKFLTREQILGAPDLTTEEVEVPEWGGIVLVRGLNAAAVARVSSHAAATSQQDPEAAAARLPIELVAETVVDEGGRRLFTTADIEALGSKSGAPIMRIFVVAQRLSGMNVAPEEVAKNFTITPSGGSSSS